MKGDHYRRIEWERSRLELAIDESESRCQNLPPYLHAPYRLGFLEAAIVRAVEELGTVTAEASAEAASRGES